MATMDSDHSLRGFGSTECLEQDWKVFGTDEGYTALHISAAVEIPALNNLNKLNSTLLGQVNAC